jgi:peptide/nickel transport system substrate-binding protein
MVIPEEPTAFNGVVADTGYNQMVMELTLLGLADIDPQGKVFPELAATLPTLENGLVKVDESQGRMDVTWKLRQDIRWADGMPVTADDVVFTWQAVTDPEGGIWVDGVDFTESIEKIDDYTFVFHYHSIYPAYLTQLGGENMAVFPAHYCDASQGFVNWNCGVNPLSSGPYILQEWKSGEYLAFERNPNYFEQGKPSIDQIVVQIVPDKTLEKNMLLQGEADVVMWVTEEMIRDILDEPTVKISFSPTRRWVMRLIPNLAARGEMDALKNPHPIFADLRVRRAMQMAIDVDQIIKDIWHGLPEVVWTEFFRPPYICQVDQPRYNPQAAKALLEEAGWKDQDGDGVRECHGCLNAEDGYPMSMDLATYSEFGPELELTQQSIGEMLREVGFAPNLKVLQGSVMWADAQSGGTEQTGDFDLDLWDDGYGEIDPTSFLRYQYHTESAEPDNGWNVGRWRNAEFDALLEQAYTVDEIKRKELFCLMGKLMASELPQILLFSVVNADAHSLRLEGIRSSANDYVTWNVANWKLVK